MTVFNPSHVPVNDAHVWSTLGGETEQIDGGWEIVIHAPRQEAGEIIAEVKDAAWRGQTPLDLAKAHEQILNVQLESKGEANIRGTVVDENGNTIQRVFVSLTGFPAVSTDLDGNFNLPAHVPGGQEVELPVVGKGFRAVTQKVIAGSKPVTITLPNDNGKKPIVSNARPISPSSGKTGDDVIDGVLARLTALHANNQRPSESALADALAPLFHRDAFYGVSGGDWQSSLYPLYRTRVILQQCMPDFRSNPAVRDSLEQAAQKMDQMEQRLATAYGINFHPSDMLQYIGNAKSFRDHLPSVIVQPSAETIAACNEDIKAIRALVKKAGFPIS